MFEIPDKYQDTYDSILNTLGNDDPLLQLNLAAVSPLDENNQIDQDAFIRLYTELSDIVKFSSLLLGGATGEGELLEDRHYEDLYQAALKLKEEEGLPITLIGGIIRETKDDVLRVAKIWAEREVEYIMVAMPTKDKLSQEEMGALLQEVSEVTNKKIIVYRTGLSAELPDLDTLVDAPIHAVKDTTGKDSSLFNHVNELYAAEKILLQGNDRWFYESFQASLKNGADYVGNISGAGNLAPFSHLRDIIAASLIQARETQSNFKKNEYLKIARDAQDTMNSGFDILFAGMDSIADQEYGGRREVPRLLEVLNETINDGFPTESINPAFEGYKTQQNYSQLLQTMSDVRDTLLVRYELLENI